MDDVSVARVAELIQEVATREILPRYGRLGAADVDPKPSELDPNDIVTIADRAAEEWLVPRLEQLVPGAFVVGEESAAHGPIPKAELARAPMAFVVDPLDGTKNFAKGRDAFGVMAAYLETGVPVASWIYLPLRGDIYVARVGGGVRLNGLPLQRAAAPGDGPVGTIYARYMPADLRAPAKRWRSRLGRFVAPTGSAAVEYVELVRGRRHLATYYKLAPWDHLPGALMLREAGGAVRHLDGSDYSLASEAAPTVALRDAADWDAFAATIFRD